MKQRIHPRERGIALFMAIFALLLLSGIAMGLMYLADTETNINSNYRASQQASAAAVGGLQEIRERMMLINVAPHLITPPNVAPSALTPKSVMYVLNPQPGDAIDPTASGNRFFDNELCHENLAAMGLANPGNNVPCAVPVAGAGWADLTVLSDAPYAGTPNAVAYKWIRLNWKVNSSLVPPAFPANGYFVNGSNVTTSQQIPVCWDGVKEILLPAGLVSCTSPDPGSTTPPMRTQVYQLTSLAVTATGARRMAQMEVAQDPPLVTNAAVDSQDHVTLNGQLTVNGYDSCSCNCVTDSKTKITTCTDQPGKTCDRSKWGIYSASTVDKPISSESIIGGPTNTTNPNLAGYSIADSMPWNYDIGAEIDRFKNQPGAVNATNACYGGGPAPCGYSCTGSPAACGTQSGQTFGIPPLFPPTDPPTSDPTLGTMSTQITYVPGNLQITGGSMGNGILIVDGDLDIHGGLQFYGLILVKGVISFTGGGSDQVNVYGSVLAGQESKVDTVLGGSAVINFDYCALPKGTINRPPQALAYRELNY